MPLRGLFSFKHVEALLFSTNKHLTAGLEYHADIFCTQAGTVTPIPMARLSTASFYAEQEGADMLKTEDRCLLLTSLTYREAAGHPAHPGCSGQRVLLGCCNQNN
jgi:hypothetical protein